MDKNESMVYAHQSAIAKELIRMGARIDAIQASAMECNIKIIFRGITVMAEIIMPGGSVSHRKDKIEVRENADKYAVIDSVEQAQALIVSIYHHTPNWSPKVVEQNGN